MFITIKQHLLSLDSIEGLKLIAGTNGLDNTVNNTNIMDAFRRFTTR